MVKDNQLKSWQKDLIISDNTLLETFYRVDSELANDLRTNIKNPTAYLFKSLGIDQQKASQKPEQPKPKSSTAAAPVLLFGPTVRTGTSQFLPSISRSMMGGE